MLCTKEKAALHDVLGSALADGEYGMRTKFGLQIASSSELLALADGCVRDEYGGQHRACGEAKRQPKTIRAYALRFSGHTVANSSRASDADREEHQEEQQEDLLHVELPDPMEAQGMRVKRSPLPPCLLGWADIAELEGVPSQDATPREPQARTGVRAASGAQGPSQVRTIRAYMRKTPAQKAEIPSGSKAEVPGAAEHGELGGADGPNSGERALDAPVMLRQVAHAASPQ